MTTHGPMRPFGPMWPPMGPMGPLRPMGPSGRPHWTKVVISHKGCKSHNVCLILNFTMLTFKL